MKNKEIYLADYIRFKDGKIYGNLDWSFDAIEETRTESIDEARRRARTLVEEFSYDEKEGVIGFRVITENYRDMGFLAVNCTEEQAYKEGVVAQSYKS